MMSLIGKYNEIIEYVCIRDHDVVLNRWENYQYMNFLKIKTLKMRFWARLTSVPESRESNSLGVLHSRNIFQSWHIITNNLWCSTMLERNFSDINFTFIHSTRTGISVIKFHFMRGSVYFVQKCNLWSKN